MTRIDNNPSDTVRRKRKECVRCGTLNGLATVPFRGRYATLCDGCRGDIPEVGA